MAFQGGELIYARLSDVVAELRGYRSQYALPSTGDVRQDAALLMASAYGAEAPPSMINVAALSLLMPRMALHEISGGAIRMVHEADLRSIPNTPPRLMQHPWLIESTDLHTSLWGDTVSLGGYELDGAYYLVGFRYPDGAAVAQWRPRWGHGEADIDVPLDRSPLIDDVRGHREWAQSAARFTLILALLLEAWQSPLSAKPAEASRKRTARATRAREWSVVRVTLGKHRAAGSGAHDAAGTQAEGRVPQRTIVAGHLRRVRYGPGMQSLRWQWIASYEARRWVAPAVVYRVTKGP